MKKLLALTACLAATLSLASCATDYTHTTFKGAVASDHSKHTDKSTTYWGYSGDQSVKETQKPLHTNYQCIIYYQADNPKVPHMTGEVHFIGQTRFTKPMTINQCVEKYKKIKKASNFEGQLYWDALIKLPKAQ